MRVLFNRDELRSRVAARPPAKCRTGRFESVMPVDPASGGTWIAANSAGLILCLLNFNPPRASGRYESVREPTSRGRIIPSLLNCGTVASVVAAVRGTAPIGVAPFRLLVLDRDEFAVMESDGRSFCVCERSALRRPMMLTSSGLGDHTVERPRRDLFRSMFDGSDWRHAQRRFHAHAWTDRPELSVLMSRRDARTVSRTELERTQTSISMVYTPLSDDGARTPESVTAMLPLNPVTPGRAGRSWRRPASSGRGPATAGESGIELLRLRTQARLARLTRWEFWPAWAVYAPLVPYMLYLSLRHRGLTVFTAANPAMPLGGFVGESKWDILARLPLDSIVPTELLSEGEPGGRHAALRAIMDRRGWAFPLILKPDVGERGSGVRLIRDWRAAEGYLGTHRGPVLAQVYHHGPHEAGVFYARAPGERAGVIFSITVKHFPVVTGDGESTVRTLIWRDPRLRVQAGVFLGRLGPGVERVPVHGEVVRLGVAGNHCQGTLFRDGAHLITPALVGAIDRIASHVPGLCFGRFDVRYADPQDLRRGTGFSIVELNGVLSESTNIYDPETSFWSAQRTLRRQWRLAYEIGAANRRAGACVDGWRRVLRATIAHCRRRDTDPTSD